MVNWTKPDKKESKLLTTLHPNKQAPYCKVSSAKTEVCLFLTNTRPTHEMGVFFIFLLIILNMYFYSKLDDRNKEISEKLQENNKQNVILT